MAVILCGSPRRTTTDCLTVFCVSWLFPWEREERSPSTSPFQTGPPHTVISEMKGSECELPNAHVDFCSSLCRVSGPEIFTLFPGCYLPRYELHATSAQTHRVFSAGQPVFYCMQKHSLLCLTPFPSTCTGTRGVPVCAGETPAPASGGESGCSGVSWRGGGSRQSCPSRPSA